MRTGRALSQFPLVFEQILKVAVVPKNRGLSPSTFKSTTDLISTLAAAKAARPSEALLSNLRTFWLWALEILRFCSVGLAKRVATSN